MKRILLLISLISLFITFSAFASKPQNRYIKMTADGLDYQGDFIDAAYVYISYGDLKPGIFKTHCAIHVHAIMQNEDIFMGRYGSANTRVRSYSGPMQLRTPQDAEFTAVLEVLRSGGEEDSSPLRVNMDHYQAFHLKLKCTNELLVNGSK